MAQFLLVGWSPPFLMYSQTPMTIESSSKRIRSWSRAGSRRPPQEIHQ